MHRAMGVGLESTSLDELLSSGESPLAHALRRRQNEIERPGIAVVAGHDSCLI
jgi:hypothetical protein